MACDSVGMSNCSAGADGPQDQCDPGEGTAGILFLQKGVPGGLDSFVRTVLPDGSFRRVVIKPNWVLHATHPDFPIEALVTSADLIRAVVEACFVKYPSVESVIVGDVPLQSCEFEVLREQAGFERITEGLSPSDRARVKILDLRRERYVTRDGFLELSSDEPGDPSGYAEIAVDSASYLEPVSGFSRRFRVSDYDPEETRRTHGKGRHRYLVARSVLEADLVVNLPKMKTHQKSGITGALKNLVGINGSKAYLVHHRTGRPSQGGDEFPEDASRLIELQVRLREALQKRSRWLFRLARLPWIAAKKLLGIATEVTREKTTEGRAYVGAGSWYGNDSIWRMVYDLNMILLYGKAEGGPLANTPQRRTVSILDGLIAGEGNGPLQPLPVEAGVIAASENPFLIDFAMARMMGFDWRKIPLLANYHLFKHRPWSDFQPDCFRVLLNGVLREDGWRAIPVIRRFVPPPGWKNHIEAEDAAS